MWVLGMIGITRRRDRAVITSRSAVLTLETDRPAFVRGETLARVTVDRFHRASRIYPV